MNLIRMPKQLLSVTGAVAIVALPVYGQTPAPTAPAPLSAIAFFTAHEWDAKLPDSPDGKKMKIHAQFTWAQNQQAIRISNQFVRMEKRALTSMASTRGIHSSMSSCFGTWTRKEVSPKGR